jgi:hypothetical protein
MSISLGMQMQFAQAMECANSGWACECMGNGEMAAMLYEQAVQGFAALAQMLGQQTPPAVVAALTHCRSRLAQLKAQNAVNTIANLVGSLLGGWGG